VKGDGLHQNFMTLRERTFAVEMLASSY